MTGLLESVSLIVGVVARIPLLLAFGARGLPHGQVLSGDRPHLSSSAAFHAAEGQARSSAESRSSSRPRTACGCAARYLAGADPRAGRRDRLLPRISQRSLELSSLHRPSSRPRVMTCSRSTSAITGRAIAIPATLRMQWTTDHEIRDLRAALAYLRTRDDHDPAGFGLFGVSRGGTTALIVGRRRARRLGGRHRRGVSDSGHDGRVHHSLGGDLRAQCRFCAV